MKVLKDVTNKYFDMIDSFRADIQLKLDEIQDGIIIYGKSNFEIEKQLIKNKDEKLLNDIDLLKELEFGLRKNYIKIVEVEKEGTL